MTEEFNLKWKDILCPGWNGEKLDYGEEVAREKTIKEDVDNFHDL
jgi:hypothetical protein